MKTPRRPIALRRRKPTPCYPPLRVPPLQFSHSPSGGSTTHVSDSEDISDPEDITSPSPPGTNTLTDSQFSAVSLDPTEGFHDYLHRLERAQRTSTPPNVNSDVDEDGNDDGPEEDDLAEQDVPIVDNDTVPDGGNMDGPAASVPPRGGIEVIMPTIPLDTVTGANTAATTSQAADLLSVGLLAPSPPRDPSSPRNDGRRIIEISSSPCPPPGNQGAAHPASSPEPIGDADEHPGSDPFQEEEAEEYPVQNQEALYLEDEGRDESMAEQIEVGANAKEVPDDASGEQAEGEVNAEQVEGTVSAEQVEGEFNVQVELGVNAEQTEAGVNAEVHEVGTNTERVEINAEAVRSGTNIGRVGARVHAEDLQDEIGPDSGNLPDEDEAVNDQEIVKKDQAVQTEPAEPNEMLGHHVSIADGHGNFAVNVSLGSGWVGSPSIHFNVSTGKRGREYEKDIQCSDKRKKM